MVSFPIVTARQKAVLGVSITFSILPVIAVFLRLLARKIAGRWLDASDYLIIIAAILAIALQACSITCVVRGGLGYDHTMIIVQEFGLEPITLTLKLLIPLQILWVLSLTFSKLSILCLYTRIFALPTVKYIGIGCMVVIIMWAIGTILASFLICMPFAMNWDQTIPGHCGNQVTSFQGTGIINLLTDIVVLLLPMPYLSRLALALYKKLVLIAVFSVGLVACVVSAYRISVLSTMDFADLTYSMILANIFSGLEPCLAIVLACIPLLRPLISRGDKDSNSRSTPYKVSGGSRRGNLGQNQFDFVDDDDSHYRLRPVGPKHQAEIISSNQDRMDSSLNKDAESVETGDRKAGTGRGKPMTGINVKQEWKVSKRPF